MSEIPEENKDKKRNYKAIIITFLAVVLIVNGVKFYIDYQNKKEMEAEISANEAELEETRNKLESISNELDLKIEEIKKLGGDVEELRMAKEEVEREKEQLRRNAYAEAGRLKQKVEGYETLLKQKDVEIVRLKEFNEALLSENTGLKTEKNVLSDSIASLSRTRKQLDEKVSVASRLRAENITVAAVNRRGRERDDAFRNRQIEQLKVNFNIAENSVAPIEGKNILLIVIDPDGEVIFDVATGSGTFMVDGKEMFYTANQEILFDNTRQEITFFYEKDGDYQSGDHTVELYADNYLIGSQTFTVK